MRETNFVWELKFNFGVNTNRRLTHTSVIVCVRRGRNHTQHDSVNWLEGIEFIKTPCLGDHHEEKYRLLGTSREICTVEFTF